MEEEKHHADFTSFSNKEGKSAILESVIESYTSLACETKNWVTNLANCSSLLWYAYHSLGVPVNWVGFYVSNKASDDELVLGPFQGKVACQLIKFGKGVCGSAASSKSTQVVSDVNKYPGHIACDGETKSEIVVPLIKKSHVLGVLDIDCLTFDGFDAVDARLLEKISEIIVNTCNL